MTLSILAVRLAVVMALLVGVSCGSGFGGPRQGEWGPLAVVDIPSPNFGMEAGLGGGRLVIGERCVTVHYEPSRGEVGPAPDNGGPHGIDEPCEECPPEPVEYPARDVLLVWRSGETKWDGARREIVFNDHELSEVRLWDGEEVDFGGGWPYASDEGEGVGEPNWLVKPDASCDTSDSFEVNSVARKS